MADIRINALATTAASTASDDFVAVDGSANGTRKLNAFSPTFGGNLTVGGSNGTLNIKGTGGSASNINADYNLNINVNSLGAAKTITVDTSGNTGLPGNLTVSGGTITGGTSGMSLASGGTNQNISITPSGTGRVHIAKSAGQDSYIELAGNGNTAGTSSVVIGQSGADLGVLYNRKNAALSFGTNGTEVARFFANGNLFVGASPVDGGQKLQVSGSAIFGSTNTAQLSNPTGQIIRQQFSASTVGLRLEADSANAQAVIGTSSNHSLLLRTNDTTALTLDSSQNILTSTNGIIYTNRVYNLTGGATPLTIGWTGSAGVISVFSSGDTTFAGTKMTMNSGASQSGRRQNLTSSITAGASTVSKKIAYVGASHSVKVSILAVQDNSVAHVATFSGDFTTSYGSNSTGGTTSAVVGNITAITVAYDNSGSPAYTINVTLTYTGNAPVIYYTIDGHSFNEIAAQ